MMVIVCKNILFINILNKKMPQAIGLRHLNENLKNVGLY